MGRWIKRHKGLFIFLCILTTVILLVGGVVACSVNVAKKYSSLFMTDETAVIERRDLVESISASGTIVSCDSVMVTARVTGVDIGEMCVEVGDYVEAGALICTLDSAKLEQTLAIAQANLDANEQSLALAVAAAQRNYNEAVNSQNQANANAQMSVAEAERAVALAKESYDAACNSYNAIGSDLNDVNSLIRYYEKSNNKAIKEAQLASLSEPAFVEEGTEGYEEYLSNLDSYNKNKIDLQTQIDTLDSELSGIDKAKIEENLKNKSASYAACLGSEILLRQLKNSLESSLSGAQISKDTAKNNWDSAQASYDSAKTQASTPASTTTVAAARDNLTTAQTNAEIGTLSAEQQIEEYLKQIEDCVVYAPVSGIVTSKYFKDGDLYNGSTIVVIENTATFDVETYISEYDISKIKVGQEVVIKTNGTGDVELEGVVKSIAPRATVTNGVTYKVVVSVLTTCDDIRLDMTAKLSIILNKAENVVTVPYESVQTDDEGNTYVEISKGKDEATGLINKEKVYVTTGVESAYYIEITSGAISEGSEVIIPRDEYNAMDIYSLLEEEGALGGY